MERRKHTKNNNKQNFDIYLFLIHLNYSQYFLKKNQHLKIKFLEDEPYFIQKNKYRSKMNEAAIDIQ